MRAADPCTNPTKSRTTSAKSGSQAPALALRSSLYLGPFCAMSDYLVDLVLMPHHKKVCWQSPLPPKPWKKQSQRRVLDEGAVAAARWHASPQAGKHWWPNLRLHCASSCSRLRTAHPTQPLSKHFARRWTSPTLGKWVQENLSPPKCFHRHGCLQFCLHGPRA